MDHDVNPIELVLFFDEAEDGGCERDDDEKFEKESKVPRPPSGAKCGEESDDQNCLKKRNEERNHLKK